jgi:hypothetical protein
VIVADAISLQIDETFAFHGLAYGAGIVEAGEAVMNETKEGPQAFVWVRYPKLLKASWTGYLCGIG